MMRSGYCADGRIEDFAIKSRLMEKYHLGSKEIDDLPSDFILFLIFKEEEIIKEKKKKIKEREQKINSVLSKNKIF